MKKLTKVESNKILHKIKLDLLEINFFLKNKNAKCVSGQHLSKFFYVELFLVDQRGRIEVRNQLIITYKVYKTRASLVL